MAWRFLFFFFGDLELRAWGPRLEPFINLAVQSGIYFRDMRRDGAALHLRVGVRAFRRLRPLARETHTRLHLERRYGLPFLLARAARRRVLVVGAGLFALALYILSSFVWVVDVRGIRRVPQWEVLAAAERLGLYPGILKSAVDTEKVAEELPLLVPRIAWAGIEIRGTRATIEIAERTPPPGDALGAHGNELVASQDGIVTKVLLLGGRALVQPGDTVRHGQVLITGSLAPGVLVQARGTVQARVWYDSYVEVGLRQTKIEPTGRVYIRHVVRLFGRSVDLGGWRPVPFRDYRLEREALVARWRGVFLPLEFDTLRYAEVVRSIRRLSEADAAAQALARARAELRGILPPGARVLSDHAEVVQLTAQRIGVRYRLDCEQDIATPGPGVGESP